MESKKEFETEVLERLAIIETKIDDYKNIREKTDKAYNMSQKNEEDIKDIVDNSRWLKRTIIGCFITSSISMFFLFIKPLIAV